MPAKNQNAQNTPRAKKPKPIKRSEPNGNNRRVTAIEDTDDVEPDYHDDNALKGIPELAVEPPTALIKIHAVFTGQHVVAELRFQWEMGNLTRSDREMLAQLGKEIAEELEREN